MNWAVLDLANNIYQKNEIEKEKFFRLGWCLGGDKVLAKSKARGAYKKCVSAFLILEIMMVNHDNLISTEAFEKMRF